MAEPPKTLPADFFSRPEPRAMAEPPKTLPADFFSRPEPPPGPPKPPLPVALGGPRPAYDPNASWLENYRRGVETGSDWGGRVADMPRHGIGEVVGGAAQIAGAKRPSVGREPPTTPGRQVAGGVSRIIRGTGEAVAPVAVPVALATAPIPTIAALGVGGLAGWGTEEGLKYSGVPPEYAALAGDVANIATGGLAAKGVGLVKGRITGTPRPEAPLPSLNAPPRTVLRDLTQAVSPPGGDVDFSVQLERSLPEIKHTEKLTNTKVTDLPSALQNIKLAKARLWNQYRQIVDPAGTAMVDTTPVADAVTQTIPLSTRIENPGSVQALLDRANAYRGRQMTLNQLEQLKTETNDELTTYYAKNPTVRRGQEARNPETAVLAARARALRDLIYQTADLHGGAAPREIMQRYGALSDLESQLYNRFNTAIKDAPPGLIEHFTGPEFTLPALLGIFSGQAPVDIGIGGAAAGIRTWAAGRNTINARIARAIKNYKGEPLPVPSPGQPKGLLGPGPIITPPPADVSGGRTYPGVYQTPMSRRLLEPGPRIHITPPPEDISGVRAHEGVYPDIEQRSMTRKWDPARKQYILIPKTPSSIPPASERKPGPSGPRAGLAPHNVQRQLAQVAERHQLPPALLHAVANVESSGRTGAVSPKGATGLMQLMPATARQYGVHDIGNVAQNIEGSARFLRHLWTKYHGNVALVAAAYNAGEGAVDRYGGVPPYKETRQYVQRVMSRMAG